MIIFDLDGTLADCEHRRHFVDSKKQTVKIGCTISLDLTTGKTYSDIPNFKPDWKAFYEACDQDKPIISSFQALHSFKKNGFEIKIWSGRCESVREKTEKWFKYACVYLDIHRDYIQNIPIKMRPIGDSTPDDVLKEKWLEELKVGQYCNLCYGKIDMQCPCKNTMIDFVFDGSESCCNMWNKKGIMCFLIKGAHGYSKNKISS